MNPLKNSAKTVDHPFFYKDGLSVLDNPAIRDGKKDNLIEDASNTARPIKNNLNTQGESLIRILEGHTHPITSIDITPDGTKLISDSDDEYIRVWDIDTGEEINRLKHTDYINSVAITPDGTKLVSGSGYEIQIWNIDTGVEINNLEGHTGHINSIVITPDGRKVISGSTDDTIRVWEIHTGRIP